MKNKTLPINILYSLSGRTRFMFRLLRKKQNEGVESERETHDCD